MSSSYLVFSPSPFLLRRRRGFGRFGFDDFGCLGLLCHHFLDLTRLLAVLRTLGRVERGSNLLCLLAVLRTLKFEGNNNSNKTI
jgi:hypothetical protein